MTQNGAVRIENTFARLRAENRKALIIYVMAGDPDLTTTLALVPKLAEAGADIVELGFPFSDPVADGPVIQAAGVRALPSLSTPEGFLELVGSIRAKTEVPLVAMTYYNPIFKYGETVFAEKFLAAGLDGVIIPDLPLPEGLPWAETCKKVGLASIFLEAPNSSEASALQIAKHSTGFIYLVSLKGVTGSNLAQEMDPSARMARLQSHTQTPVAVGFGISTPEQAARQGAMSDGVIVGSAVVNLMGGDDPKAREDAVLKLVQELRNGLDRA